MITYTNGTYQVKQYQDGTKILIDPSNEFEAEFPDNIDVKITDYCDVGCKFCYENSRITGKHCNSAVLLEKLSKLPSGIEVTLGGGNPVSHPDIERIISTLKEQGKFISMTVNENSLGMMQKDLDLRALGISPISGIDREVIDFNYHDIPIVFHFIMGVHPIKQVERYLKSGKKVLILGYKSLGRGKNMLPSDLEEWSKGLKRLKFRLVEGREFPDTTRISLDNLAIRQANFKKSFTAKEWDTFYLGEDGFCSMYIDAVSGTYSESSTVSEVSRTSWDNLEIINYFKNAKTKS